MGWLFGYYERRPLIEHLINGNGLKTVKHFLSGNNLWCVHEYEGKRWACLYLLRGSPKVKNDPYNWGTRTLKRRWGRTKFRSPTRGSAFLPRSPASTRTRGGHGLKNAERKPDAWSSAVNGKDTATFSGFASDSALLLSLLSTRPGCHGE